MHAYSIIRLLTALLFILVTEQASALILEASVIVPCKQYSTESVCRQNAENQAFSALSMQLLADVNASTIDIQSTEGVSLFRWESQTSSNLPIFGAKLACTKIQAKRNVEYACSTELDVQSAAKQYAARLTALQRKIEKDASILDESLTAAEISFFYELLIDLQQYERLSTVYNLLVPDSPLPELSITPLDVSRQLTKFEENPKDFNALSRAIAPRIIGDAIFIKPILPMGSFEVTPFSNMLYQELSTALAGRTTTDKDLAQQTIAGTYQVQNGRMTLVLNATDTAGQTYFSRIWQLPEALYKHYETKPKLLDFERLIAEGILKDDAFQVFIQTNKGNRGVVFHRGEKAKILIKMTRSGYFYIVGNTLTDSNETSYLMEVNNEKPPYAFEQYVSPEDVNRWLLLGEFDIIPEFGSESLQVFASDSSFITSGRLPKTQYDGVYHKIIGNENWGIPKTRGLIKAKTPIGGNRAEAVLIFQTYNE